MTGRVTVRFMWGVVLALAAAAPAAAQDMGTLNGRLTIAGTSAPVQNARVQIVSLDNIATSDETGRFSFPSIPAGMYTLVIQAVGLQPKIVPAQQVRAGAITEITVELRGSAVELEPIEVRERSETELKASTNTSVIRGDELPSNTDIMNAIQGRLPGFSLGFATGTSPSAARATEGDITGPTGRRVLWVLDGVVARGRLGVTVNASEVDCMEIRRGARSALEYSRINDEVYDAVIIIWTNGNQRRVTGACASEIGN